MFSHQFQYALITLLDLAKTSVINNIRAKDIAERHKLPTRMTELILNSLVKQGLVESIRGAGGGFRLAKKIKDITLYDVKIAIGEQERADQYFAEYKENTSEIKQTKQIARFLVNKYRDALKELTLQDLYTLSEDNND